MTLGSRIGVMRDGSLEQVDRPGAVYGRPVNTFVAQFVGSPAMNLIVPGMSPHWIGCRPSGAGRRSRWASVHTTSWSRRPMIRAPMPGESRNR